MRTKIFRSWKPVRAGQNGRAPAPAGLQTARRLGVEHDKKHPYYLSMFGSSSRRR
ncbi:hypothetical protein LIA77_02486 [Sarocladium implicatum]|nr:hypothetical protein LIA77_02486 [Sarocladium implicatum]